jgi:serine/threonine protein kinase
MKTETKPTGWAARQWQKEAGTEPLPGYRLLEPLGRGGFGEVWKCEAPGGLWKAIKFVRGNASGQGKKEDSASVEFQAIQCIKNVRHPFVLSIDRVEMLDGELVLVMELADRNLADRFAECRAAGHPGIDRDELLRYMTEAAEALDLINFQHGLQHLDVKPANLFVVSGHIKVADFGLVNKVKEGGAGALQKQGGLTPSYVAPELLRGQMSHHSDQYSLAIVYQELLTGTFPFSGENPSSVMLAHLSMEPDLSALSDADRLWVGRALAKEPERRFPSCLQFIRALVSGMDTEADGRRGGPRPLRPSGIQPNPARPSSVSGARPAHPVSSLSSAAQQTVGGQGDTQNMSPTANPVIASDDDAASADCVARPCPQAGGDLPPPGVEFGVHISSSMYGELFKGRRGDGEPCLARVLPVPDSAFKWDPALLERVSGLRHPGLQQLDVAKNSYGHTVLLTDPAEQTLQDRFRECVDEGLVGIQRDELLGHLGVAAATLDALAHRHRLWHLGLSPRSIVLTEEGVSLAEFGLAQLLWLPRRRTAPHWAARYAAPELLQGTPNATCDAYSLALIYAEMLTGFHPVPKRKRVRTTGSIAPVKPDLDWLPAPERIVIAKALDPEPRRRFSSCEEMLDSLAKAGRPEPPPQPPPAVLLPPVFVPVANLSGGSERLAKEPSIRDLVTHIVLAETSAASLEVAEGLTYLCRKGRVFETRIPIGVLPNMIAVRLAFFIERWNAEIKSEDQKHVVLHLRGKKNFWQAWLERKIGVEVRLELRTLTEGGAYSCEALVTAKPFGGFRHAAARNLHELAPALFLSLRDDLQTTPDQRGEVRWPCSQALDVYPVQDNGAAADPLEVKCLNLSFSGIEFWSAQRPATKFTYVHFKTFPKMASFATLAQIVHSEPDPAGGFRNGAMFVAEAQNVVARLANARKERKSATEGGGKPINKLDHLLRD